MDNKQCPKCGAKWISGQLYWSTGKEASELDLAGLVCNNLGDDTCINELRGESGGTTWEKRIEEVKRRLSEFEQTNDR
tara:strand:+ start:90 stop:323 length:234 start_codon:yes stop_codon:yes gene_type:complete